MLSCLLLGGFGCATGSSAETGGLRCPEPTPALMEELVAGAIPPATRDYLGRLEVFCSLFEPSR